MYASTPDLKAVTQAFVRDGVPFRFVPVWVTPEQVTSERRAITEAAEQEESRKKREAAAMAEKLEQRERLDIIARLHQIRPRLEQLAKQPLPPGVRDLASSFVARIVQVDVLSLADLRGLEAELTRMHPRFDEASKLAAAMSPKSAMLLEGDRAESCCYTTTRGGRLQ